VPQEVRKLEKYNINYSLSAREVQKLVLEYAIAPLRDIPEVWNDTRMARVKWFQMFSNGNLRQQAQSSVLTTSVIISLNIA
jgi:hypothetical protein